MRGQLRKMHTELADPVIYRLPLSDAAVTLNPHLGKAVKLVYSGQIFCIHCGRKTAKSFNQGYCYPCFKSLAQCDMCIVKPEQCHYDDGTCREPEWAHSHCFQPHIVYLADSSAVKVGITRYTQLPTRWIDQGAMLALPVLKVASRYISGLLEIALAKHVSDKTSWQKMLKQPAAGADLYAKRDELLTLCAEPLEALRRRFGNGAIKVLSEEQAININFPVLHYPNKVTSFNLDKQAEISGVLQGIKGQYLIFDTGVINIRKFAGYEVELLL
ncbi:MAG: DUF2797 domain-containing protein [Gammaproteobacteria bacterium]